MSIGFIARAIARLIGYAINKAVEIDLEKEKMKHELEHPERYFPKFTEYLKEKYGEDLKIDGEMASENFVYKFYTEDKELARGTVFNNPKGKIYDVEFYSEDGLKIARYSEKIGWMSKEPDFPFP